jgi:hypothetical protein
MFYDLKNFLNQGAIHGSPAKGRVGGGGAAPALLKIPAAAGPLGH